MRDRAVALLLINTGLRIGECAALDVDDVAISARKGRVIVRECKGDAYREVPLNAEARDAMDAWSAARHKQLPDSDERALFVSRQGAPLSTRALDLVIRALAREADLALSAHTLAPHVPDASGAWRRRRGLGRRARRPSQAGDDAALQLAVAG